MKRRIFLRSTAALALGWPLNVLAQKNPDYTGTIVTVRGPIEPDALGPTLPHEHVLVDFIGWKKTGPHRYDRDKAFELILPHLKQIHQLGCRGFVECTPAYLGRDPILCRQLSEAVGLHIITNTGYYGARNYAFVPGFARKESPKQLANRWIKEWEGGIDDTGIRPGFIKTGVNTNELGAIDRKLLRAAAITHRHTGLTIACHTGNGTIKEQIAIIEEEGLAGEALIWTHAQNERRLDLHEYAAKKGCWLSLDGVNAGSMEWYVDAVLEMKKRGVLNRVLLSQDAGWYSVGEPNGGRYRSHALLFQQLLPMLKQAGLSETDINLITVETPKNALTIGVKTKP